MTQHNVLPDERVTNNPVIPLFRQSPPYYFLSIGIMGHVDRLLKTAIKQIIL